MEENVKSKRSIKSLVGNIIFWVLLIYLVAFIFFSLAAPKLVVKVFGFRTYVVATESMEPKIMVNDTIVVVKKKMSKIKEGDIITFYSEYVTSNGKPVPITHYVMSINYDDNGDMYFLTCSEMNPDGDGFGKTYEHELIGKVSIILKTRGFMGFLRQPIGIVIVVMLVAGVAITVYLVVKIVKDNKKKKNDEHNELE